RLSTKQRHKAHLSHYFSESHKPFSECNATRKLSRSASPNATDIDGIPCYFSERHTTHELCHVTFEKTAMTISETHTALQKHTRQFPSDAQHGHGGVAPTTE